MFRDKWFVLICMLILVVAVHANDYYTEFVAEIEASEESVVQAITAETGIDVSTANVTMSPLA